MRTFQSTSLYAIFFLPFEYFLRLLEFVFLKALECTARYASLCLAPAWALDFGQTNSHSCSTTVSEETPYEVLGNLETAVFN